MATGVRVQHPQHKNARYTIVDGTRPYPTPYQCTPPEFGGCGGVHLFKTHHLTLDETGSAILAKDLYQKIKHLLVAEGFTEVNTVRKPPAVGIGVKHPREGTGQWGNIPIIRGKEQRG
jgi:hypothetical protein